MLSTVRQHKRALFCPFHYGERSTWNCDASAVLKEEKPRNDTGTVDPVVPVILYGKLTMHWCEEKQH